MRPFVFLALAIASSAAIQCPKNCTSPEHGTCDLATGKCSCLCRNQYRCFRGSSCSKEYDPYYGWDNIDCHGGKWMGNWTEDGTGRKLRENPWYVRWCTCPKGWTGTDCSVCSEDSSCRTDSEMFPGAVNATCDHSVYVFKKKEYVCNITTPELAELLKANASVAMECRFPPPSPSNASVPRIGQCSMHLFNRVTGPPLVFSCDMFSCAVSYDSSGNQRIACPKSACNCTDWCAPFIAEIVAQMQGPATLDCTPGRKCTFVQDELGAFIPQLDLTCITGECFNTSFTPIVPDDPVLTKAEIVVVSCSGGIAIAAVATALALWFEHWLVHNRHHASEIAEPALLSFVNIVCSVREKRAGPDGKKRSAEKILLEGVTGEARPGQIMAILGASGAGKTSLLDILAGRKNTGTVSGGIYVNGRPMWQFPRRTFAYVTQDDVMMGTLTVREHLEYAAMLRLPDSMTGQEKRARVTNIMIDLGLADIANTRIGTSEARGISGGERKRLNIASELLSHPRVLFLDEPTSGLDSHSALQVVSLLKRVAETRGCTVVMSIHQPRSNIVSLFDTLVLLAHAKMVYSGPAAKVLQHFEARGHRCPPTYNPADFLIDTIHSREAVDVLVKDESPVPIPEEHLVAAATATRTPDQQQQDEKTSLLDTTDPSPAISPGPTGSIKLCVNPGHVEQALEAEDEFVTSYLTQLSCLCKRTFLNVLRDPFLLRINYGLTITVALLLGALYWKQTLDLQHGGIQNRMGIMFFLVCLEGFFSLTSIDTFFGERQIFVRERANGCYRTSAYYVAKLVCDFVPQRIIPPLVLGCIVYFMANLRHDHLIHFALFLLILVLLSIAATSVAMCVSCVTPSVPVGNLVVILSLFFGLLFGGFLVMKSSMSKWIKWLCQLSIFNYSFEALNANEFDGVWIEFNPEGHSITPINGRELLNAMGLVCDNIFIDIGLLAAFAVLFLVIGYCLLRWVVREKR